MCLCLSCAGPLPSMCCSLLCVGSQNDEEGVRTREDDAFIDDEGVEKDPYAAEGDGEEADRIASMPQVSVRAIEVLHHHRWLCAAKEWPSLCCV